MSTLKTPRPRALVAVIAGLLLVAGLTLLAPAPAAVAAGPQLVAPSSGATVPEIPTFQWKRTGAARYDVQVSTDSAFSAGALVVNTSTASSRYVPTVQLPSGPLWWRVRPTGGADSDWRADTFTRAPLTVPTITNLDGSPVLDQPSNPPVVTWSRVDGAQSYTLQLSPDSTFTDQSLLRSYTVSATSYVVPDPQVPTTYYARVRTTFPGNLQSGWSSTRSYTVRGLAPAQLDSPAFRQSVTDVALDWKPVVGAVAYDVQVDDDQGFSSPVVDGRVVGTRYAPGNEFQNDSYYWRVRPVDASGNVRPWSTAEVWEFTRTWPGQPTPVYPADGATVGDPFYFQWTPSEPVSQSDEDLSLASSYVLQISDRQNFQGTVRQCATTLTTLVPQGGDCFPSAQGTYWWRVLGTDDFSQGPSTTRQITAKVSRFTYAPAQVTPIAPANGGHVTVPTLSWQPVVGAAQYRVTIRNLSDGNTVVSQDTPSTRYTSHVRLDPGTYEWQVQTLSADGRVGAAYITGWPTFVVDAPAPATATLPQPIGSPSGQRFPTLTWTPVANATSYQMWAKPALASGYTEVDTFPYAAGEDLTDRFLVPGDYDYFLVAFNSGARLGSGSVGRFTIDPLGAVPAAKQFAALTGTDLPDDPDQPGSDLTAEACSTQVLDATGQSECDNLRNTPVLTWATQPNVGSYLLYVARDKEMTNGVYGNANGAAAPIRVTQAMWTPTGSLADSQANTAYYVRIVPCTYGQGCGNLQSAENSFDKLSRGPVLAAPRQGRVSGGTPDQLGRTVPCDLGTNPADGSQVPVCANDVTLSWQDFRNSETTANQPTTERPFDSETVLQTPGQTEARSYVVQVATDPGFQNVFDSAELDQTTYTAPGQTYPEAPLYWRVRAIDGTGNPLPWSRTGTFIKRSPVPTPTVPADGSAVPGDTTLAWNVLGTAAYYHVEVYKNGDTTASPGNRVLDRVTRQRVLTLDAPFAALPSGKDYVWRVQRFDQSNRAGDWSSRDPASGEKWMHFTVDRPAPALGSPAAGATGVTPADTVFTWSAVDGAASYQWERLAVGGATVLDATRTTALAWSPQDAVPGGDWDWRVTAYDAAGSVLGTSPPRTFTVTDTVTATTALIIFGSGRVGETLTLDGPDWNFPASEVTTTYQWLRDGGAIAGQSALTYTVTEADRGHQLSVRATGTRDGYRSGTTTSNTIAGTAGNAPVATTAVVTGGSGKVATTLTSAPPVWDSPSVTTTYQWRRDGTDIPGATQSTYTVRPEDVGKALTLAATGSRTGYDPGTSVSGAIVGQLGDSAVATTPVSISGANARTGTTWSVTAPTWDGAGVETTYQWFRDGSAIAGATGASYRLTDADIGTSVTVRASGKRTGYQDGTSTSNAVAVTPLDALAPSAAPSVKGVPAVRETLSVDPGTWPGSGVGFTYQWFVDNQAVAKETGSSYVVRGRDAGHAVTVRVSATADGWAPGSATSAPVKVALMTSTTTAGTTTPTLTQKQRAVIDIKVALADYGVDLGQVQVLDGKKVLAKVALKSGSDGTARVRLKKLKRGKHKLSVVYLGNAYTQPSKAKPLVVVVTAK